MHFQKGFCIVFWRSQILNCCLNLPHHLPSLWEPSSLEKHSPSTTWSFCILVSFEVPVAGWGFRHLTLGLWGDPHGRRRAPCTHQARPQPPSPSSAPLSSSGLWGRNTDCHFGICGPLGNREWSQFRHHTSTPGTIGWHTPIIQWLSTNHGQLVTRSQPATFSPCWSTTLHFWNPFQQKIKLNRFI